MFEILVKYTDISFSNEKQNERIQIEKSFDFNLISLHC